MGSERSLVFKVDVVSNTSTTVLYAMKEGSRGEDTINVDG